MKTRMFLAVAALFFARIGYAAQRSIPIRIKVRAFAVEAKFQAPDKTKIIDYAIAAKLRPGAQRYEVLNRKLQQIGIGLYTIHLWSDGEFKSIQASVEITNGNKAAVLWQTINELKSNVISDVSLESIDN